LSMIMPSLTNVKKWQISVNSVTFFMGCRGKCQGQW
jgi:hypothetical protein